MKKRDINNVKINVAWIENGESYAKTLSAEDAYNLKEAAKKDDSIIIWWFQRIN